jgi:hypothetical protein
MSVFGLPKVKPQVVTAPRARRREEAEMEAAEGAEAAEPTAEAEAPEGEEAQP